MNSYSLNWHDGAIITIDQRGLPHRVARLRITTVDELIAAIRSLAIRGAPALGVAGALGVALSASANPASAVRRDAERISAARPTAANLAWGVRRALAKLPDGPQAVLAEAQAMLAEDVPFVVVCPESTRDQRIATGRQIAVEQRPAAEINSFAGVPAAPEGTAAFNPAFDVTPAELITAVVTEEGVVYDGLAASCRCT